MLSFAFVFYVCFHGGKINPKCRPFLVTIILFGLIYFLVPQQDRINPPGSTAAATAVRGGNSKSSNSNSSP
jgi:hypothetical protein